MVTDPTNDFTHDIRNVGPQDTQKRYARSEYALCGRGSMFVRSRSMPGAEAVWQSLLVAALPAGSEVEARAGGSLATSSGCNLRRSSDHYLSGGKIIDRIGLESAAEETLSWIVIPFAAEDGINA